MYIFSNKETGWKFVFAFVGKAASHMGHESSPRPSWTPSPPLW